MTGFDDRSGMIWLDGKLVAWPDAKLHVLSHGLHYASAVFEGERVYGGQIFKLDEHTERLLQSARILDFEIPFPADKLCRACEQVVTAAGIVDGYVRPIAWRGSEVMGVSAQQSTIHVSIAAWEWPAYFEPAARMKGIRMQTSKWRRPAPDTAPVHSKAAGLYMTGTLAKHAAEEAGYADALMLDYRGLVAEGTGANIFLAIDGKLHTPVADCFLDGITRRTIIELAQARGIEVVERHVELLELTKAQEVFLTGTAAEITPVSEIDEHRFTPGQITRQLSDDYDIEVRRQDKKTALVSSSAA